MDYPRGYEMFKEFGTLTGKLTPPNVTTFAYYGCEYPTPEKFIYTQGEFPDTEPEVVMGDGDGTVNINSLESCSVWSDQMSYKLTMMKFPNVEHVDAIKNSDIIQLIDNVVCNMKS